MLFSVFCSTFSFRNLTVLGQSKNWPWPPYAIINEFGRVSLNLVGREEVFLSIGIWFENLYNGVVKGGGAAVNTLY